MPGSNQPPIRRDDLQKIKGIGRVAAQALYSLGINTYEELARYTPASLADLLIGKVSATTLRSIARDNWPEQARSLVLGGAASASGQEKRGHTARIKASSTKESGKGKSLSQGTWRELADFYVSFGYSTDSQGAEHLKTRVRHSQANNLNQWEGIATDELIQWMLKQANLPEPPKGSSTAITAAAPQLGPGRASSPEETMIALSDVWVTEVKVPVTASSREASYLRVECRLVLQDPDAVNLTYYRVPFSVDLYLVDTATNETKLIDTYNDRLSPGDQDYHITQDIAIPQAGRYQLFLFARLLPPAMGAAHLQGPVVRIEP